MKTNKILIAFMLVLVALFFSGDVHVAAQEQSHWSTVAAPADNVVLQTGQEAAFRGNWHSYDLEVLVEASNATGIYVGFGAPWVPGASADYMNGKFYSLYVEAGREAELIEWLENHTDVFSRNFYGQFLPPQK